MSESALITSMRAAVAAAPDDVPLRLHLAELLLAEGAVTDAIVEVGEALRGAPDSTAARNLMLRALAGSGTPPAPPEPAGSPPAIGESAASPSAAQAIAAPTTDAQTTKTPTANGQTPAEPADSPTAAEGQGGDQQGARRDGEGLVEDGRSPEGRAADGTGAEGRAADGSGAGVPGGGAESGRDVDWGRLEDEFEGVVAPRFVHDGDEPTDEPAFSVARPTITLADVGGMDAVKQRLEIAFLAPMRNPKLRALYRKSLRGGLLLYGPPGCGKTYIASALAGELGARFIPIGITDVLDMYTGGSERNLHELFTLVRRSAPAVLFLDEVDALGQKRSQTGSSTVRSTVNQLLLELDSVADDNEGVFVLAATNQPWDVDPALSRPGRFDRTVLVLPPDGPAREAILAHDLTGRPVAGIDLATLAERTDGFSGADLVHLCETAAERALLDSIRDGEARMITMADFDEALRQVRPSTGRWLEAARGVAMFANAGGAYDDLVAYLQHRKLI